METRTEETPAARVEMTLAGWSPRQRELVDSASSSPPARLPRITRLMALAIKFQDMIDRGEVRDYADLARLGYVTRARLTQIMNLCLLAPDIQERILDVAGPSLPTLNERQLRRISAVVRWADQRNELSRLRLPTSIRVEDSINQG